MSDLLDDNLFEDQEFKFQFNMSTALLWCGVFFLGAMFKLMHWPFQMALLIIGSAGLMGYSISSMLTLKGKSQGNNFSLVVALVLVAYLGFKVIYQINIYFVSFYLGFTAVAIICYQIIKHYKIKKAKSTKV